MRNWQRFFSLFLFLISSCSWVPNVKQVPDVVLGEASFYPTIAAHTDAPIVGGNRLELLFNGNETFPAMLKAIRSAQHSITYMQFVYEDGAIAEEFAEAFAERCRAGVPVKLLIDSRGGNKMPKEIPELWQKAGCDLQWFRRIRLFQFITPWELLAYNYRNHRRILVIDGKVGFTGGHGVKETWTGDGRTDQHWRDTDIKTEGPIVQQLQAAFVESWRETTDEMLGGDAYFPVLKPVGKSFAQVVKSSPYGGTHQSYLLYLLAISAAQKSVFITNPYFVPDDRLKEALIAAAARGVRVVVLGPGQGKIDWTLVYRASRRGFGPLLQGNVEIYEFQGALLHAKTMVVDGTWALVGTTNLDNRSFALNEEINMVAYDRDIASQLEHAFIDDLSYSQKLDYATWAARPWREKVFEVFTIPINDQL